MDNISTLIAKRLGYENLLDDLVEKLSGSELNSLLLELFRKKVQSLSAPELLQQFQKNRFVAPSSVDAVKFRKLEIECLEFAAHQNFKLMTLSPLTPLGTCSVAGFVDQNNVVSTVRGTEVVSDATNVFALMMADVIKSGNDRSDLKFATAQRHVRSQFLFNPALTPHFGIFCLATGGFDRGSHSFELEALLEHIQLHLSILDFYFSKEKLLVKVLLKGNNEIFRQKLTETLGVLKESIRIKIDIEEDSGDYYQLIQFKFFIDHNGNELNLSDGGFVAWTQKLLQNNKHRLMISGIGTELIYKIKNGMI